MKFPEMTQNQEKKKKVKYQVSVSYDHVFVVLLDQHDIILIMQDLLFFRKRQHRVFCLREINLIQCIQMS